MRVGGREPKRRAYRVPGITGAAGPLAFSAGAVVPGGDLKLPFSADGIDPNALAVVFDAVSAHLAPLVVLFDVLARPTPSALLVTFSVQEPLSSLVVTFDVVDTALRDAFAADVQVPAADQVRH